MKFAWVLIPKSKYPNSYCNTPQYLDHTTAVPLLVVLLVVLLAVLLVLLLVPLLYHYWQYYQSSRSYYYCTVCYLWHKPNYIGKMTDWNEVFTLRYIYIIARLIQYTGLLPVPSILLYRHTEGCRSISAPRSSMTGCRLSWRCT